MNGDDPKKTPPAADTPATTSPSNGSSGKGADTAFQAMLRKRKLAELPEPPDSAPPPPPAS